MDKLDLIYEFTDGNLDANQEKELFRELSINDELRQEFKQELAMKQAIRTDVKAFTPTVNSTLNVFSSLGFTAPAAIATGSAVTTTSTVSKLSSVIFGKLGLSVITGISAVLITGLVSYFTFQNQISELQRENSNLKVQITELNKNDIPKVSSFEKNTNSQLDANSSKPIIKYVYLSKDNDESQLSANDVNIPEPEPDNAPKINDEIFSVNSVRINTGKVRLRSNYTTFVGKELKALDLPRDIYLDDIGLNLEFTKLESWHDNLPTVQPKTFNKFNNTAIRLMYNLNEFWSVGSELRQETFFQKFTGLNNDNMLVQYEQQPNFTSFGILAKYQNKNWKILGIYPYFQLFGGGTNVGYITRGLLGLRYSPVSNLEFYLGAEYSKLFYQHQGNNFQSGRFDLNYGVSVGF